MSFVPLLVLSASIKKVVDLVKYGASGDINAVVTQVVSWVTGIVLTWALAQSDFGAAVEVNGTNFGMLNAWSQAWVGFSLASTAGMAWDTIKAVDSTNSAIVPNLLSRTKAPQGVPGPTAPVREP